MPGSAHTLHRAHELYASLVLQYRGEPAGATDSEIDELQLKVGFALPAAYREFLRWMGHENRRGRDALFSHDRVSIDHVIENEEIIDELLRHQGHRHLAPPRMLVWLVHEVYASVHFPLPAESDDPICYSYFEGNDFLKPVGKFSTFLAETIEGFGSSLSRQKK